jgi:hypothetical protein
LQQLRTNSANETIVHGACLGLGLSAMATQDQGMSGAQLLGTNVIEAILRVIEPLEWSKNIQYPSIIAILS